MKPIAPQKSLMELTAIRIREAIISGELPLGSKVSEQKLAEVLGVSRSPVREALALLQIEGLVQILPKRGTFIFTPDTKSVDDLIEYRAVLEAACLKLAIQRNAQTLERRLRRAFERMESAIKIDDMAGYVAGDLQFHRAIVECSGNQTMQSSYDTSTSPLLALRTHLFTTLHARIANSMDEHAELISACAAQDIALAQTLITRHIGHLADDYRRATADAAQPDRTNA